jgi:hypothetical protein
VSFFTPLDLFPSKKGWTDKAIVAYASACKPLFGGKLIDLTKYVSTVQFIWD